MQKQLYERHSNVKVKLKQNFVIVELIIAKN